jgi:hypothetical protein
MSGSLYHQHHTATVEPDSSTSEAPFRFLDLPAELRVKIYGFVCYEDRRIDLFNIKLPAITRVSRLIRHSVKMLSPRGRYTIQDIDKDYFLQPLHQAVTEHVKKNGSGGISLEDLQSMAQTVNLPPRDHPRVAERVVWTGEDAVLEYVMRFGDSDHCYGRPVSMVLEEWIRSERRWGRR